MLKSFPTLAVAIGFLTFSSLGFGAYDGSGISGTKNPDSLVMHICRAEARDDSGLFWMSINRDRDEARYRVLEQCSRFGRGCRVTCETNF